MEPIKIDQLVMKDGRSIHVMRDDLLPGGSKQRAVVPLLREMQKQGVRKVTYASPFAGFAQVALAQGCREVGLECRLYAEFDPTQDGCKLHPYSQLAQHYGSEVIMTDDLKSAELLSQQSVNEGFEKIPLGFQCALFQKYFQSAIRIALKHISNNLGRAPRRIWLPVGSATLANTFLNVIDRDIELLCVDVHVLPESDPRITQLKEFPQVRFYSASQQFIERSDLQPPLPSNLHYDAKLWRFITQEGRSGDLWWNVAK